MVELSEIQAKLHTLYEVLNVELLDKRNRGDKEDGFDPSDPNLLEMIGYGLDKRIYSWRGSDVLKLAGTLSTRLFAKYVLLEVKVEQGGESYSRVYLRGFEGKYRAHIGPATDFLEEVTSRVGDLFQMPSFWPQDENKKPPKPVTHLAFENNGVKLTISVLGGGEYVIEGSVIHTYGSSEDFGPVPSQYTGKLEEMLSLLTKREQYKGFEIQVE